MVDYKIPNKDSDRLEPKESYPGQTWVEAAQHDRMFGHLTDSMVEYYDNEVRAECRNYR
jgi:hypothetical protein